MNGKTWIGPKAARPRGAPAGPARRIARGLLPAALVAIAAGPLPAQISDVGASNFTSTSATITWATADSLNGCVRFGVTSALGDTVCDPRPDDDVHFVELDGLAPETDYFYEVESGGEVDDDGGALYTFRTAQVGFGTPYVVYGNVLLSDEITEAPGTLIRLASRSADGTSAPIAALTDAGGNWALNLGNLKDPVDGSVFTHATGDSLFIDAHGGVNGTRSDTTTVSGASPQDAGTIVLPSGGVVSIPGARSGAAPAIILEQNEPNPFNPVTTVTIHTDAPLTGARVVIFDLHGRPVRELRVGTLTPPAARLGWDGRDGAGHPVPSGVYLYRLLHDGGASGARKAVLVK
jgi:hypothetical protein